MGPGGALVRVAQVRAQPCLAAQGALPRRVRAWLLDRGAQRAASTTLRQPPSLRRGPERGHLGQGEDRGPARGAGRTAGDPRLVAAALVRPHYLLRVSL